MSMTIQHFVSQHLGRGVATVETDEAGRGAVRVVFADPAIKAVEFAFSAAEFDSLHPGKPDRAQFILRLAIGQIHRDLRKDDAGSGVQPLSPMAPPWLGDFADAPFGGGTVGFLRRNGVMDERRQGNDPMEACVNQGLFKRKSEGRRAARCYLEQAKVPESIIRRVLSHTAQRRRTRIALAHGAGDIKPGGEPA